MFPQARIGRLDRDTVRGREDFERALNALNAGELDMLVGTQMIAKGHDVHGVTLVGVVGGRYRPRPAGLSRRRTHVSVTHAGGRPRRARAIRPAKLCCKLIFPITTPCSLPPATISRGFYDKELQFRSWMHYPPYSAIANVLSAARSWMKRLPGRANSAAGSKRRATKAFASSAPPRRPSSASSAITAITSF